MASTKRAVTSEAARTSSATKKEFCTIRQSLHKTTGPDEMRVTPGLSSFRMFPVPYGQKE